MSFDPILELFSNYCVINYCLSICLSETSNFYIFHFSKIKKLNIFTF